MHVAELLSGMIPSSKLEVLSAVPGASLSREDRTRWAFLVADGSPCSVGEELVPSIVGNDSGKRRLRHDDMDDSFTP